MTSTPRSNRSDWDALVGRYIPLVWALALQHGMSEADAADVVQSTWLRLLEQGDELRDQARIEAWLATTARTESLRLVALRRHTAAGVETAIDERGLAEERDQEARDALGTLSPAWQSLVALLMSEPPAEWYRGAVPDRLIDSRRESA